MIAIHVHGETFQLHGDRAVSWPAARTLFVADVHFGKAAAFRASGVPIPHGTTADDLSRLTRLLAETGSRRLVVLGDFLHARSGRAEKTLSEIVEWRRKQSDLEIVLVRGNHDRTAGDPPRELEIACADEPYEIGAFACVHDDAGDSERFVLQGHVHPKVFVGPRRSGGRRFPCFVLEPRRMILPAFGSFTGGHDVVPRSDSQIFAVIEGEVLRIPAGRQERGKSGEGARLRNR